MHELITSKSSSTGAEVPEGTEEDEEEVDGEEEVGNNVAASLRMWSSVSAVMVAEAGQVGWRWRRAMATGTVGPRMAGPLMIPACARGTRGRENAHE